MPQKGNIGSTIAKAAVFIILEIAALVIISHNGELQKLWVARGTHRISALIWGGTDNIRRYFSLGKENERLAQENFELMQEVRRLSGKDDVTVPGSLSEWNSVGNFRYLPAAIVRNSTDKQHNTLLVGKGKTDGVAPGDGVITPKGIVGIVNSVSDRYSCVISFANSAMVVSTRIGKEGAVGPLSWDGFSGHNAILKEIPLHTSFEPGDTVYTSGFSSIFPPDIPLGTVNQSTIVNGATYDIRISLFETLTSLRYVTVVNNLDRQEIEEVSGQ